jgi:hypothetical protein
MYDSKQMELIEGTIDQIIEYLAGRRNLVVTEIDDIKVRGFSCDDCGGITVDGIFTEYGYFHLDVFDCIMVNELRRMVKRDRTIQKIDNSLFECEYVCEDDIPF